MENKANTWLVILSFLVPILGLLFFFLEKDKNVGGEYLGVGIIGFIVAFLLTLA